MNNVNQLIKMTQANIGKETEKEIENYERQITLAGLVLESVFPVLNTYYPDFTNKYGNLQYDPLLAIAKQYAERLLVHSVGPKLLDIGIERCKAECVERKWSPNPEEFARLCKPTAAQLGLPDFIEAKAHIIKARGVMKGRDYKFKDDLTHELNRLHGFEMYDMPERQWEARLLSTYQKLYVDAINHRLPKRKEPVALIEYTPKNDQSVSVQDLIEHKDPLLRRLGLMRQAAKQAREKS
jgi:hypothetical protein